MLVLYSAFYLTASVLHTVPCSGHCRYQLFILVSQFELLHKLKLVCRYLEELQYIIKTKQTYITKHALAQYVFALQRFHIETFSLE